MPDPTFAIRLAPNHLSTDLSTDLSTVCQLFVNWLPEQASGAPGAKTGSQHAKFLKPSPRDAKTAGTGDFSQDLPRIHEHWPCTVAGTSGWSLSRFPEGFKSVRDVIDTVSFSLGILSWHCNGLWAEAGSKMRSKMESMDGRKKRELLFFRQHWLCTGSQLS